jgi:6-oxo-cyclohex-1-ene-carbonyl-CoA hydrolase
VASHDLTDDFSPTGIRYETRAVLDRAGEPAPGLHTIWLTLDNPKELNSYTTGMIKEIILGLRKASNDRAAVAVVLTPANTPRSTPAHLANIASTCACSTTW